MCMQMCISSKTIMAVRMGVRHRPAPNKESAAKAARGVRDAGVLERSHIPVLHIPAGPDLLHRDLHQSLAPTDRAPSETASVGESVGESRPVPAPARLGQTRVSRFFFRNLGALAIRRNLCEIWVDSDLRPDASRPGRAGHVIPGSCGFSEECSCLGEVHNETLWRPLLRHSIAQVSLTTQSSCCAGGGTIIRRSLRGARVHELRSPCRAPRPHPSVCSLWSTTCSARTS